MKTLLLILATSAIVAALSCCKKNSPQSPLAPGAFTFQLDGVSDTLYGGLDTSSNNFVFSASGIIHNPGFYYNTFVLTITVQNFPSALTKSLKGTVWDTTFMGNGNDAVNCQFVEPASLGTGYSLSLEDEGFSQPFRLQIISNTGNNIQAAFSGKLYNTYAGSSTYVPNMQIENGRLSVNY